MGDSNCFGGTRAIAAVDQPLTPVRPPRPQPAPQPSSLESLESRAAARRRKRVSTEAANVARMWAVDMKEGQPSRTRIQQFDKTAFQKNIDLAKSALDHVQSQHWGSTNRGVDMAVAVYPTNRSSEAKWVKRPEAEHRTAVNDAIRNDAYENAKNRVCSLVQRGWQFDQKVANKLHFEEHLRAMRDIAVQMPEQKIPMNCGDLAVKGFDFLAKISDRPHLDIVSLKDDGGPKLRYVDAAFSNNPNGQSEASNGPDHTLLLLNRDPNTSTISDSNSWGPETIVADLWAHRIYSAVSLPEEMYLLARTTCNSLDFEPFVSLAPGQVYHGID